MAELRRGVKGLRLVRLPNNEPEGIDTGSWRHAIDR
jgi:hypothetical protein